MELGQRVIARAEMHKDYPAEDWTRRELEKPIEGIVTAKRNRRYGGWEWDYEDGFEYGRSYRYWVIGESFEAYDVTFSLHRKPIVVLPQDLEVKDE